MSLSIFLHGLEGSSHGTKSVFFREKFPDMLIPDFEGSLQDRMRKLDDTLKGKFNISLVGSSFGGLMATLFAFKEEERVDRLILLAPALNLIGFTGFSEKEISVPVRIYHGINDDVIPAGPVEQISRRIFRNLSFHMVEDDHFLHNTFKKINWDKELGLRPKAHGASRK
jgi:pimeloyl-ACP methyl ester carboxylesterase